MPREDALDSCACWSGLKAAYAQLAGGTGSSGGAHACHWLAHLGVLPAGVKHLWRSVTRECPGRWPQPPSRLPAGHGRLKEAMEPISTTSCLNHA